MIERLYTPTARRLPVAATHSPEWHELRRNGIGGSDVSAIMGLSPYKSALELWGEKTGKIPPEFSDSEAAKWGRELEPIVVRELAARIQRDIDPELVITPSPGALVHQTISWLRCNPDGMLRRARTRVGLVEVKTVGVRGDRDWAGEPDALHSQVAAHALLQVVHSMLVTGYDHAYVGVLIGGQKFKWRRVDRDDELEEIIYLEEERFWDCVQNDKPPAVDGSESSGRALQRLYGGSNDDSQAVELESSVRELLERFRALSAEIKARDDERELLKQRVQLALGDASYGLCDGQRVVSWKPVTTTRLDSKAIKKAHPELAATYSQTSSSRRFALIKESE